jgi:hypothetical protein
MCKPVSFEYSKMILNATMLPIYPLLTCRDLSRQPVVFLVARFLVHSVAHIPIAHGRLYHTPWHTGKERPNTTFILCKWAANMVGRQKDPFVYCGTHSCLDRNPRYYRIAITGHFAIIPYFLPFCQQSSPCASVNVRRVNVRRVHSGQSSRV